MASGRTGRRHGDPRAENIALCIGHGDHRPCDPRPYASDAEWTDRELARQGAASAPGAKEPTSTRGSASRRCVTERAQEATPASAKPGRLSRDIAERFPGRATHDREGPTGAEEDAIRVRRHGLAS